jgi:hypothetical protein
VNGAARGVSRRSWIDLSERGAAGDSGACVRGMALAAKERKLSRLGSKGSGGGGGGGSFGARGQRAPAGTQRRLFAAFFAFLFAGAVLFGAAHVIGGETRFSPSPPPWSLLGTAAELVGCRRGVGGELNWILVGFS